MGFEEIQKPPKEEVKTIPAGPEAELNEGDRMELLGLIERIKQNKWAKAIFKEVVDPLNRESLSSLLRAAIKNRK